MRLDDLWTYLVANSATYIAALSTVDLPLAAITDKMRTRDPLVASGEKVSVYLDAEAEEIEEDAPSFRVVKLTVDLYVLVNRGTESKMLDTARLYAKALESCLRAYPYYFTTTARDYYDGPGGNADFKGAKLTIECKYEEDV